MMFSNEYDMVYCCPEGPIRNALKDRDVCFFPLKSFCKDDIANAIKILNPDIIHSHDAKATVFSALVSSKIPIISHLHGNDVKMKRPGLKALLFLLASQRVKKIITVSESCLADYFFKKQIQTKTVFIRNIVYRNRIEKLLKSDCNAYDFDFIFVGRLCYPKNPKKVAAVASIVLNQCPKATFGVIGDGELRSKMKEVFVKEGVIERVTFTGVLSYPYKTIQNSKCLLMCSRFEGTPIVALEAMALGVPIVSTPVDGVVDIVSDGETGFLSDDIDELAMNVKSIVSKNSFHEKLSKASFEKFEKINDYDGYFTNFRNTYNSIRR